SRLIHNVLTFGRQQRDQLTVHPRAASLDEVTQRVAGVWRPGLEARGFTVECSLHTPHIFKFDPDAVEQIIGNLLSNVEKYAESGHFVSIATQTDDKNARLTIEDHGPGIPARMRANVFAPFVRVRNDVTEGVSGTGIGLSISRNLAELHGGSLSLENVAGGGSRFVLTLPFKQDVGGGPPTQ
ncbi:MAG: HAMP domain-containing histidine kinase, partial [Verrucomicrobia bacterium]|nr:HAMP domain-containing histidine kinase [Verrucomicrobiota bacterium]